jgi:hypothetical protein
MFKKIVGAIGRRGEQVEASTSLSPLAEARLRAIKERAPEIPNVQTGLAQRAPQSAEDIIAELVHGKAGQEAKEAAILSGIHQAEGERPLSAAAFAAKEIMQQVINALKDGKGVHAETAFCVLGTLAGYACQAAIRMEHEARGDSSPLPLDDIQTADGRHFFFGDALNGPLVQSQFSVWSLAAGAAQQSGCQNLPDIEEIFAATAKNVGGVAFGVPRVPEQHRPGLTIEQILRALWPRLHPLVQKVCLDPMHWPIAYGLAIQDLFRSTKGMLDPNVALRIVIESAVPSSKLDLSALR